MNKDKKIKTIILCGCILMAIILTFFLVWTSSTYSVVFGKDYSFEDDYNLYKEYADIFIKTGDNVNEDVEITSDITKNSIKITVNGTVSKVVAEYPVEFVEEPNGNMDIIILHKNATYENYTNLPSIFNCIAIVSFVIFFFSFVFYMIIIDVVCPIIKHINTKKNKKKYN